ncbi:hypothetical protein BH11GEM2_BH11GEM2_06700 [soil metagenome]
MGRSEGRSLAHGSLSSFVGWLEAAPASTTLSAADLLGVLAPLAAQQPATTPLSVSEALGTTWRERLWSVPPETRLGVREAAEALGRPKSWVYRHTAEKGMGEDRLPHRKLDGELLFVAGELRAWLTTHEEVVVRGHVDRAALSLTARRAS